MKEEVKIPFVRISRREDLSTRSKWGIRIGAIVLALFVGCIPLLLSGANPFSAYIKMVQGSFGTSYYIKQTVRCAVPLLGCALAIAPCFKMKFWNIGAEGQITMGAIFATFFAVNFGSSMPRFPLLVLMFLASILGGALWAAIPGFFKAKFNTNETLFTLMMNYIAIGIAAWLQGGPWEGRKGTQLIPMFSDNARLPKVFGVDIGWIIIAVLVVLMFIYMNYTKQGYEVAVIGDSLNTARYAGMNVSWIIVRTMLISGAIGGLVGFILVSGQNYTLTSNVANGIGFTAITVAWLAQLNPFAMILIATLLSVLTKGASYVQQTLGVPSAISDIISGILLLFMLGSEFFINFKMNFRHSDDDNNKEGNIFKRLWKKLLLLFKKNREEVEV